MEATRQVVDWRPIFASQRPAPLPPVGEESGTPALQSNGATRLLSFSEPTLFDPTPAVSAPFLTQVCDQCAGQAPATALDGQRGTSAYRQAEAAPRASDPLRLDVIL